jgi:DNA-binding transcriptional ArsR family regulator
MSTSTLTNVRAGPSSTSELSRDVKFTVLSNARRRDVLRLLRSYDEPVGIRKLAERIAAWENDTTPESITYKQRKRVYTSLHQTHLPALEDAGLIDAARTWEGITLTTRAQELETYLDGERPTSRWSNYYFGFASVGLAVTGVAWFGLYPFSLLPGLAYATVLSLLLFVTALVHTATARR